MKMIKGCLFKVFLVTVMAGFLIMGAVGLTIAGGPLPEPPCAVDYEYKDSGPGIMIDLVIAEIAGSPLYSVTGVVACQGKHLVNASVQFSTVLTALGYTSLAEIESGKDFEGLEIEPTFFYDDLGIDCDLCEGDPLVCNAYVVKRVIGFSNDGDSISIRAVLLTRDYYCPL